MNASPYLTAKEGADYARVGYRTFLDYCKSDLYGDNALVYYPRGGRWLFLTEDIDRFIKRNRKNGDRI